MPTPKGAWTVASLLFVYMMVNFADKAVVGLAAVPIMKEMGLSPKEYGALGSSFFLLFSISGILVGFVGQSQSHTLDHFAARRILGRRAVPDVGRGQLYHASGLPRRTPARARVRRPRSPYMPSTNGSPMRSVRCRPPFCRKARRSA